MSKTFPVLDLFAGVGGLSLGFELLKGCGIRYKLLKAVEIDPHACETLRTNHGKRKVIEADITAPETKSAIISACKGKVKVIVGGIPCQSFSLLGPRSGHKSEKFKKDKRDTLYRHYYNIVKELSDSVDVIVIENVKGILSKKDDKGRFIYRKILADFKRLGYGFDTETGEQYMILNAADYGVPQKRERVIFIGVKKRLIGKRRIPVPVRTHAEDHEELHTHVSLWEAIGDLPNVKPFITTTGLSPAKISQVNALNKRRNTGKDVMKFNQKHFERHVSRVSDGAKQYLSFIRPNAYPHIHHHTARSHQMSDLDLFEKMPPGWTSNDIYQNENEELMTLIKYDMSSFKDKYRRQHPKQPCTTIFAHMSKDGNRFIHPKYARTLTPREAARVQSFPDHFIFEGPLTQKYKQIGNAVPPLLSLQIAQVVTKILMPRPMGSS